MTLSFKEWVDPYYHELYCHTMKMIFDNSRTCPTSLHCKVQMHDTCQGYAPKRTTKSMHSKGKTNAKTMSAQSHQTLKQSFLLNLEPLDRNLLKTNV